jgi:ABC-2 type transport system permease protein
MNKILLISKREFISRVQKRTFLLVTIGLPLLIGAIYAAAIYFGVHGSSNIKIAVIDNAHFFQGKLSSSNENISFVFMENQPADTLAAELQSGRMAGYINVPAGANVLNDSIAIVMEKKIGIIDRGKIKDDIQARLREVKISSLITDTAALAQVQRATKISFVDTNDKNDSEMKSNLSSVVGYVCGFLIYMILLLYGASVMRGVMEEKTNRIAEIIVSSVKPFQLMMGKILGIGAVGLLQFLIWIVLTIGLRVILVPLLFPSAGSTMAANANAAQVQEVLHTLSAIPFELIIPVFIIYFLGGYFLYASLFAAIGCTVSDGQQDAQGLTPVVTLPIIFGLVIMLKAVNEPTSSLSVFGSLFPLTSPIVMMARVAQGVPDGVSIFQLALSIVILFATFLFTTWFAAKIYRTGILMYGKKPTWSELMKWAFRK